MKHLMILSSSLAVVSSSFISLLRSRFVVPSPRITSTSRKITTRTLSSVTMMKEVQEQQQQQGTTDSAIVIPRTMKCIVYGDQPGIVDEAIRPTPKMGTGGDQVVVQVHAVELNPVDAKDVMGDKLPRSLPFLRSFARRTMVQKNIIGFDFAGKIVSIDNTSSGVYQIGDHVFGTMPPFHGSLAEYIVAPMDQIAHMPKCYSKAQQGESTTKRMTKYPLSFIQASSMPLVCLTVAQCLNEHMIRKTNETVATGTTTNTALLTQKKKSILIIGGSGGTGHVAVQMSRYYWNEHVQDVTVICSKRNVDFCYQLGATHVVTYDNDNTDDDVMTQLSKLPSIPFDIVLDCVTSDDPRDQNFSYPEMIQQHDNSKFLLANDYIYRRLGGSTMDWIRAGVERVIGLSLWKTKHEKLFWIKFPKSSSLLQELTTTMERDDDTTSPNDVDEATKEHSGTLLLPPIVESQNVYPFTKYGVEDAFGAILSRRVRGKVVIEIIPSSS